MDQDAHRKEPSSRHVPDNERGEMKHWGLMALCCVPMVAIVIVIAFGIWSF